MEKMLLRNREKLDKMVSNVWRIGRKLSPYILLLGLFVSIIFLSSSPAHAAPGINQQLNFQGRLLNSSGATVPDGYYNVQFKIYQDGDGQTPGNATGSPAGSLKWTESYLNDNSQGVTVVNGFMSVQLGSITPFGSSIDWNQDTLWLSMNIGGTSTSCTPFSACSPDGEMVPMKRLSANAYAINSSLLGGLSSADFLQFAQGGVQTDSSGNTSIAINKISGGNIIELQSSGNAAFTVNNSGDLAFGNNADHSISVAAAASGAGNSLAVSAGNAASGSTLVGGNLVLQGGAGDGAAESGSVIVKSNTNNSVAAFQVQNAAATPLLTVNTTNNRIQIGSSTPNTNEALLVLNNYSSATDPATGINGAMYYNSTTKIFRCYNDGSWVDCAKAGGVGGVGDANKVAYFNSSGNLQTSSQFAWADTTSTLTVGTPAALSYSVGDTGPAGGVIFYDKGDNTGGWRYLESSTTDQGTSNKWGCYNQVVPGADGTAIGDGINNTVNVASSTCKSSSDAAVVAAYYAQGGYDDWFLPSKDELNLMYAQRALIGGFAATNYWSSTQDNYRYAWIQNFSSGAQSTQITTSNRSVRSIREVSGNTAPGLVVNTANSHVGIGTTNPLYNLDVAGSAHFESIKGQYSQAITVDAGGNGDYTSIDAAYSSAKTRSPSASNRIVILVYPGSYNETLTMDTDYISIYGAGKDSTTWTYGNSTLLTINASVANSTIDGFKFSPTAANNNNRVIRVYGSPTFTNNQIVANYGVGYLLDASTATGGTYSYNTFTEDSTGSVNYAITTSTGTWTYNLFNGDHIAWGGISGGYFAYNTITDKALGTVSDGTFVNNYWKSSASGYLTVTGGKFYNNTFEGGSNATNYGAVNISDGSPEFVGGRIYNNSNAGAVKLYSATATPSFSNLTISSPSVGIALSGVSSAFISLTNVTVSGTVASGTIISGSYQQADNSGSVINSLTGSASQVGMTIQGSSSQTANLFQLQDSNSVPLASFDASGNLGFGSNSSHNISVAVASSGAGKSLTVSAGNAASGSALAGGDLVLSGGAGDGSSASGSVIVKSNTTNSTTAFQVQNASGTSVLGVDTTNSIVQIGSATPNTDPTLLVLNNYSDATDPTTGTNGAMYYNTSMKVFRCYNEGAWVNCAKAGGIGGVGDANKVAFFNTSGNIQTNNQFAWNNSTGIFNVGLSSTASYVIGDTGPGGGIIFYDKGDNGGGWRYIEAASTDASTSPWGCDGVSITTGPNIGDGPQNTANMMAGGCENANDAGKVASDYSNNGYDDWFLPSSLEMTEMYNNRTTLLMGTDTYWTSTQTSSTTANRMKFTAGTVSNAGKTYSYKIRPIRKVSSEASSGLFVDTATNQIGIGTTNPAYKLDVDGAAGISGNLSVVGQVNIKQDSSVAFQVQNSSSSALFTTNTDDGLVQVGSASANTNQNLFVLNNYSSATDPTNGTNGAMYYNTSTNSFRCFVNGAWSDCSGAHGSFVDLQGSSPGASQAGNFNIDGTGIASTLQGTTSVITPLIDTATATTLSIGTTNASSIQIGSTALSSGTQNIGIGNNNTAGGTTNVTIGSGSSATAGTTALQAKTAITLSTDGIARGTFDNAGNLYLGNGVTASAPSNFTLSGTGSNTTAVAGGTVTIQGGNATTGNANGGNIVLSGGNGVGSGSNGLVVLSTPTFSTTANDPNCFTGGSLVTASCTIANSSVNNSAAIFAGFSTTGKTVTLPDPANTTAGRIIYLTAANGSQDFTLIVNGGGAGNSIAMRQNTSATMIWNGSDWTAAGASSSTTLQSAYDNTLQSAGGAELVVSHTANTNGLTIRDSSVDPVNGTLLSVQTASAAVLLSVNSNVTEYSTNGGAEVAGGSASTFPAGTWSSNGSSTVSRYTTAGDFIATGKAAVSVATSASAGAGVKNTLSTTLTANTNYNVSFATRLASGTFTDMDVYYSANGSSTSVTCKTNQAVATSIWTKVNCTFAAPASGINSSNAILIRQTSGSAHTFYVDNLSVTIAADYNYATDPGVDDNINFSTNWSSVSGASVSRTTSYGNDASDSAQVVTSGSGQGIRNKLAINPLPSTLYRVSVYAASTTSGFNNFTVRYSRNGGANFVNCADYNTQTVSSSTSNFTQITCYITTDGSAATNPYIYFTQSDSTGRTFFVDTLSVTLSSNTTPNVQIGGGVTGGPVTLLTLDKGASAPIASNNDALLGSMYYDTTLGKLQCYEADGWGACGSSPDNIVTISPEYTNAVLHGTGVGTMTSDICSDALNINDGSSGQDTICGSNETFNFYKWTSPQATDQTYSIYITYQLPGTFKSFASGQTSIMGRTDSANSSVTYQVYRNDATTGLSPCGSAVAVSSGAVGSWQTGVASGAADPSTCGFAPGNSIVLKITMTAKQNADAYVSNLNFIFSNR